MRECERDSLRALDWSKVYASVPAEVNDGARLALLRIRQRRQRRNRMLRWAACAACLALAAGAGALLRGGERVPDRAAPRPLEGVPLTAQDEVYASREDARFHVSADCPQIRGDAVALRTVTALEFEKELCPVCGANVLLEGD